MYTYVLNRCFLRLYLREFTEGLSRMLRGVLFHRYTPWYDEHLWVNPMRLNGRKNELSLGLFENSECKGSGRRSFLAFQRSLADWRCRFLSKGSILSLLKISLTSSRFFLKFISRSAFRCCLSIVAMWDLVAWPHTFTQ